MEERVALAPTSNFPPTALSIVHELEVGEGVIVVFIVRIIVSMKS